MHVMRVRRISVVAVVGVATAGVAVLGQVNHRQTTGSSAVRNGAEVHLAVAHTAKPAVSGNWSGYAPTGRKGQFHAVAATWTVPAAARTRKATYSSAWVGIDGALNGYLIQTGTQSNFVHGRAQYGAWWEILPHSGHNIHFPVHPGDRISASITKTGRIWTIRLADLTTGYSFHTSKHYTGPGASAEWIVERPTVNNNYSTLAHYGQVTFSGITVNGAPTKLRWAPDGVDMKQKGHIVSTIGLPCNRDHSFTVAYGSTPPASCP